jgi:chemotaxis response regulator CheB
MKAKNAAKDFPVVCVGGSASGLDAYIPLLRHLPADMGVAIVIVNHLRTVATLLHEILPQHTEMPVELITERLLIQPNSSAINRNQIHRNSPVSYFLAPFIAPYLASATALLPRCSWQSS